MTPLASVVVDDIIGVDGGGPLPLCTCIDIDVEVERPWPFDPCSFSKLCIVSDFFISWTHHLVTDLGIPRIVLYSFGAFSVSILNHA